MTEIDFAGVVKVLKESAKLVRATRRLLSSVGVQVLHMSELEISLSDRAKEVEEYAQMLKDDVERPLLG